MVLGLWLLSRLDVGTSTLTSSLYLLVLGLGLGSVMQVLVLAVQNSVSYEVLGAATSGVTLFRGHRRLAGGGRVRDDLQLSSGLRSARECSTARWPARSLGGGRLTGTQVARLPAAGPGASTSSPTCTRCNRSSSPPPGSRSWPSCSAGSSRSVHCAQAAATSRGWTTVWLCPAVADSLAELERALSRTVVTRAARSVPGAARPPGRNRAEPGATWALVRIGEHGFARARELAGATACPGADRAGWLRNWCATNWRSAMVTQGLTPAGDALAERAIARARSSSSRPWPMRPRLATRLWTSCFTGWRESWLVSRPGFPLSASAASAFASRRRAAPRPIAEAAISCHGSPSCARRSGTDRTRPALGVRLPILQFLPVQRRGHGPVIARPDRVGRDRGVRVGVAHDVDEDLALTLGLALLGREQPRLTGDRQARPNPARSPGPRRSGGGAEAGRPRGSRASRLSSPRAAARARRRSSPMTRAPRRTASGASIDGSRSMTSRSGRSSLSRRLSHGCRVIAA